MFTLPLSLHKVRGIDSFTSRFAVVFRTFALASQAGQAADVLATVKLVYPSYRIPW